MTDILGIQIPSTDPVFLTIVGFHILIGLACVISGAVAIFSRKGRGRHSRFGALYFWLLAVLFGSASILSLMRWTDDYHLFILGSPVLHVCNVWTVSGSRSLASLAKTSPHRHGPIVYRDADRVFGGQRQVLAGLARAAAARALVCSKSDWAAVSHPCAASASRSHRRSLALRADNSS